MYAAVPITIPGIERDNNVGELDRLAAEPSTSRTFASPKSRTLTFPFRSELDIARFQIAVNNAFLVCCLQRVGYLLCNRQRFVQRNWPTTQPFLQRLSLDKFHHDAARGIRP